MWPPSGQTVGVPDERLRNLVVLAPMPLEMDAIVAAFGLRPNGSQLDPWSGQVGGSAVIAVHIGMGPAATREAVSGLLKHGLPDGGRVDHVMIAGICGGLDPDLPVGTVLNPETVIEHPSGRRYVHRSPPAIPPFGHLITTETVSFDRDLSLRFFADGCLGVDMESSAVAEVCEPLGVPWSVYRCISDRHFDGLLDERIVGLTKPDGTLDADALDRLLAEDPEVLVKLEQLGRDSTQAARLAAEAALSGCRALD